MKQIRQVSINGDTLLHINPTLRKLENYVQAICDYIQIVISFVMQNVGYARTLTATTYHVLYEVREKACTSIPPPIAAVSKCKHPPFCTLIKFNKNQTF